MTLSEILSLFSQQGITLRVENHTLRYHAPKGALTAELRKLLTDNKESLITFLDKKSNLSNSPEHIAVIGMACRFPGAADAKQYWENIRKGVESIRCFRDDELDAMGIPPEIYNAPNYVKAAPILEEIDMFDAAFFGYSPREAEIIDPQQRLFLECASNALEHAGYDPGSYHGKIGVFGGAGSNYYGGVHSAKSGNNNVVETYQWELGNANDYLATRVAYKLGLKGPALTIQTACSTSLVASHVACQNLLTHQCDMALAGGVSIDTRLNGGYFYQEGMILSPDGHCRAFDAKGQGTVGGQGVGIVVLKRMSEAVADSDRIYAVILGSAFNNDGAAKVGFTAPSVAGQSEVIIAAHAAAGITPGDISYVEAHGTGTPLGDPIEIKALTRVFRLSTSKRGYCPIGSVKTNIGHLDAAAGVAGLIKTILMLEHKEIPPTLHFENPNPNLDLETSPFFVNTQLQEWQSHGAPRRAGVSAFGLGGTNAHMIIEEAPIPEPSGPSRARHVLTFSARTEDALNTTMANMALHLEQNPKLNLADVAYTLQTGRKVFNNRATVICSDADDAIAALRSRDSKRVVSGKSETGYRDVVFMFSGQGSQYANMGLDLYNDEPVFREQIDYCSEILQREISVDLRRFLYPAQYKIEEAEERLKQTSITQPSLFAIEYALARLWMSWGIRPQAFVGHSIGEYTAACLAGVFSLEDALKLVALRGRLMQEMPHGSMLAVFLPEEKMAPFMNGDLSVSVINSPSICVVSGKDSSIDGLENYLSKQKIMFSRLHTSHAFHSKMMDPVLAPYTEEVRKVRLALPRIPFLSNLTGTWITEAQATDPGYWARQLRGTVRFADCMQELFRGPGRFFLEVGPGGALTALAGQHPAKGKNHVILSSTRHPKERQCDSSFILNTLSSLWRVGVQIDWMGFHAGSKRRRVALPTYPFEHKRFWSESWNILPAGAVEAADEREYLQRMDGDRKILETKDENGQQGDDNILVKNKQWSLSDAEKILTDMWRDLLGYPVINPDDDFFALGGHSLVAIRLFTQIDNIFGKRLPLATLLSSSTVRQLASLLVQDEFTPSWSSLVKIKAEGAKPPLFLIHSEGGNVLEYFKLASYLDKDRPVYGLQARGLEGKEIIFLTIEEMASHFISEMKTVQPEGPYFMGGFCLGGMITFEMARQMEAKGDYIAFLAMINSYSPDHLKREIPNMTSIRRTLYSLIERVELEKDNLSVLSFKGKLSYIGDRMRQTGLMLRVAYEDFVDLFMRNIAKKAYHHSRRYILEKIRDEQAKAFYCYKPSAVKIGITLFRASRQPRALIHDRALGWADCSENVVVDYEIKAFHKNILKDPNVRVLAQKFQECLDEAQSFSGEITSRQKTRQDLHD